MPMKRRTADANHSGAAPKNLLGVAFDREFKCGSGPENPRKIRGIRERILRRMHPDAPRMKIRNSAERIFETRFLPEKADCIDAEV